MRSHSPKEEVLFGCTVTPCCSLSSFASCVKNVVLGLAFGCHGPQLAPQLSKREINHTHTHIHRHTHMGNCAYIVNGVSEVKIKNVGGELSAEAKRIRRTAVSQMQSCA
jgi:hypothetical protein